MVPRVPPSSRSHSDSPRHMALAGTNPSGRVPVRRALQCRINSNEQTCRNRRRTQEIWPFSVGTTELQPRGNRFLRVGIRRCNRRQENRHQWSRSEARRREWTRCDASPERIGTDGRAGPRAGPDRARTSGLRMSGLRPEESAICDDRSLVVCICRVLLGGSGSPLRRMLSCWSCCFAMAMPA